MSEPYALEELITFGRLERAVTRRATDAAESYISQGKALDRKGLADLVAREYQAAREAIKTSPMAKEAALERVRQSVSQILEGTIRTDREAAGPFSF
ncbi:MAG: hypothetical protein HYX95_02130 [Chloroflexi bacterium]|nr:hypothetical protein [Chloroflexota bacterium]